jgi:hypothetical protein
MYFVRMNLFTLAAKLTVKTALGGLNFSDQRNETVFLAPKVHRYTDLTTNSFKVTKRAEPFQNSNEYLSLLNSRLN